MSSPSPPSSPSRRHRKTRTVVKELYPIITPPPLSMSELICKTLDDDIADMVIDKWLEHRHDMYSDWFLELRGRREAAQCQRGQMLTWNKGEFAPENFFCRTVDTARVIPLDRTWTTHVFYHKSMQERGLSMVPVLYTMLPEIMLLRGMHDHGCDDIWIIVTDLSRSELDDITEYFKLVTRADGGRSCKPSLERKIRREHTRIDQTLRASHRLPCFPQIDMTFRAILNEKKPPFIIIFSHQKTSYSQIFFTHEIHVPKETVYCNFPTGCPNPNCGDDCEMVRFPRNGVESAVVLPVNDTRLRPTEMCNWLDCRVCFSTDGAQPGNMAKEFVPRKKCSKCKLVSYCSAEHQKLDWEEHKRVCVKSD